MKALIVSASKNNTDLLVSYAHDAGYDTITYTWLLKALDNVEEITPHLVILSAVDYPRQWKTFIQYAESCIPGFKPDIVLLAPAGFDESEIQKAHWLGVRGYITGTDEAQLAKLRGLLQGGAESAGGLVIADEKADEADAANAADEADSEASDFPVTVESVIAESVPLRSDEAAHGGSVPLPECTGKGNAAERCKLLFVHPKTGSFVTGKVVRYEPPYVTFLPDQHALPGLKAGTVITDATLKNENGISSVRAEIIESGAELTLRCTAVSE
ncbi:hypothetical protein [Treponema brennaborense]|uniref:Response regulatory domain-containing protein n=1 Tax=Treponema brennaborense (strain DSM 12168 / CIP 105900 / DD5/3) TaxID=906968 RepID=F4LMM8_TREBD|nr:hypothetical protein [Treponema brennaborense]AEE16775.1 hypothetical protein Trebr_1351 [Treponema brennaborense DSM 12168]